MIDPNDWQQDGAELDAIMDAHRGSSFPPGVLDAYLARQRRRHSLVQNEIERALAAGLVDYGDDSFWGRPPRP